MILVNPAPSPVSFRQKDAILLFSITFLRSTRRRQPTHLWVWVWYLPPPLLKPLYFSPRKIRAFMLFCFSRKKEVLSSLAWSPFNLFFLLGFQTVCQRFSSTGFALWGVGSKSQRPFSSASADRDSFGDATAGHQSQKKSHLCLPAGLRTVRVDVVLVLATQSVWVHM